MKLRYALALLLGMTCTLLVAGDAKAQCGLNGGYGYGYDVGRLYGVLADNVPHFAAFPPVYYSAPVPRTYGYSPFAYPPGTRTPELAAAPQPVEIINPHFTPATSTSTEAVEDKVTQAKITQPLLVMNPYVSPRLAEVPAQLGR
jgi:hypothetical protein